MYINRTSNDQNRLKFDKRLGRKKKEESSFSDEMEAVLSIDSVEITRNEKEKREQTPRNPKQNHGKQAEALKPGSVNFTA